MYEIYDLVTYIESQQQPITYSKALAFIQNKKYQSVKEL
jgi:hypothetical protein